MADQTYLDWPFLTDAHRALADQVGGFAAGQFGSDGFVHHGEIDAECREILTALAGSGITKYAVPAAYGGAAESLDVRSLCLIREHLAYQSGLADFVFAMQGLGSGTISLFGSDAQKSAYLPDVAAGRKIAAFALTEPEAGSDVSAIALSADRDENDYVLNGEKTFI